MFQQGSKSSYALLIVVLLGSFVMIGVGMAIYANTIVRWWIPVAVAAAIAILTAQMMCSRWSRLTDTESKTVNFLCHVFVAGSMTYFLFLGLNYWCADPETKIVEQAEVVDKYQKSHTRYRRVSRNRRVPDGNYYTYHLVLEMSDGREKEIEVTFDTYRTTRNGSHRNVTLEKGLFGITVIKHSGARSSRRNNR